MCLLINLFENHTKSMIIFTNSGQALGIISYINSNLCVCVCGRECIHCVCRDHHIKALVIRLLLLFVLLVICISVESYALCWNAIRVRIRICIRKYHSHLPIVDSFNQKTCNIISKNHFAA